MFVLPKGNIKSERKNFMKKKVLCTAMAVTILLTQTASAASWQMRRNQLIFDSEIGFIGNVTLQFASDGGSFIRPITKRYGKSISLESYVPTKYGYTFKDEPAEIVREIYTMYLDGSGFKAIAEKLNKDGKKSPSYYQKLYNNKNQGYNKPAITSRYLWDPTAVKRVLTNEFYTGTLVCHIEETVDQCQ